MRQWRYIREIEWAHTWKLTKATAFPHGLQIVPLLIAPVSVPLFFALQAYQQYQTEKLMSDMKRFTAILRELQAVQSAEAEAQKP